MDKKHEHILKEIGKKLEKKKNPVLIVESKKEADKILNSLRPGSRTDVIIIDDI